MMHTRHKDELMLRLEKVADIGACHVRASELRVWFGRERITKTVWSEILEYWNEIDRHSGNGIIVGFQEGTYTFVFNDSLVIGKDSWWDDLASLAGSGD